MKPTVKIGSFFLAAVMALSAVLTTGCSLNKEWSYRTSEKELAIGVYIYCLDVAFQQAQTKAKELEDYYTGADWKRDFADDEAGLLPKELRRGVLSEDGIWDALEVFRARLAELPDELPPRFASLGRVSPQGIDPRETSVAIPQGGDTLTDDTLPDT